MRWIKRMLIAVVVLIALLIGGAVVLIMTVDPNDYKDQIAAAVQDATGRQLTLGGDIALTVFPRLGLRLEKAELSNAEGFGESPFARVEAVNVNVELLPLLRQELRVDRVQLKGLYLDLQRDASGRTNWDDLTQPAAEAPAPPVEERAPSAPPLQAIAVQGLEITGAHLQWNDAQAGTRMQLKPLNLQTGALEFGKPMPLRVDLRIIGEEPALTLDLDLSAQVTVEAGAQRYVIEDLAIETAAEGDALPSPVTASLGAEIAADLSDQTASVGKLVLKAFDTQWTGTINATQIMEDALAVAGRLKSDPFSPRAVMKALAIEPPETADAEVLKAASLGLDFQLTSNAVAVEGLEIKLDDTTVQGKLAVKDLAKQAIVFDLRGDEIDVDRYLPPPVEAPAEAPAPQAPPTAQETPLELPMETLRALNIDGTLGFGKLKVSGLTMTDLKVTLSAHDGLVQLQPFGVALYQGRLDGKAAVDARRETPAFAAEHKLAGVQVGDLLNDLVGKRQLSGTTEMQAKLKTQGQTTQALRRGLDGDLSFAFKNGAIEGINVAHLLRSAKAKLSGKPMPAEAATQKTDFSSLTGTATIRSGVANNPDLSLKSPLLRILGAGTADLVKEETDYKLDVAVVGTLEGEGGKEIEDLKGLNIPLQITGPFAAPKVRLNLDDALKARATQELDKQKAKLQQKIEETRQEQEQQLQQKLQDTIKDKLKLF